MIWTTKSAGADTFHAICYGVSFKKRTTVSNWADKNIEWGENELHQKSWLFKEKEL